MVNQTLKEIQEIIKKYQNEDMKDPSFALKSLKESILRLSIIRENLELIKLELKVGPK